MAFKPRTHQSQPSSIGTNPVKRVYICTYCVCIMCIYLHMLKYDVWSRSLMLTHPSPGSPFLLFSLQIKAWTILLDVDGRSLRWSLIINYWAGFSSEERS